VLRARECRINRIREIESTIAIAIWTLELEESSRRRMEHMSLPGWHARAGAGEFELEPQFLYRG